MKKRVFSLLLMLCIILPAITFLSACGDMKSVANKTFVYSKCTVSGSTEKKDVEETYKGMYLVFGVETYEMYNKDGILLNTYTYAIKNKTIYEVDSNNQVKTDGFKLKISGNEIIIEIADVDGAFKLYLKESK